MSLGYIITITTEDRRATRCNTTRFNLTEIQSVPVAEPVFNVLVMREMSVQLLKEIHMDFEMYEF